MKIEIRRMCFAVGMCLLLLSLTVSLFSIFVSAESVYTDADSGLSIDVSFEQKDNVSGDIKNGVIVADAEGTTKTYWGFASNKSTTHKITLTNNSGFDVLLRGSMLFSGGSYKIIHNSTTVANSNASSAPAYTNDIALNQGQKLEIEITSPPGAGQFGTFSYAPKIILNTTYTVNFDNDDTYGTYTVDGETVSNASVSSALGVTLTVSPKDGYTCVGFVDTATGYIIDGVGSTQTTTFYPSSDCNIHPK